MRQLNNILFTTYLLTTCLSSAHAQNYSKLIGRVYNDRKSLTELKNCISIEVKVDPDRNICNHYFDTLTKRHIIFVEKEAKNDTIYSYKISDILELDSIAKNSFISIGSNENEIAQQTNTFVIAIECCWKRSEEWPSKSKTIIKAWSFDKSSNKLVALKTKNLHRINEGYYY